MPGTAFKVQFGVMENARYVCERFGLERIGFLTLTMPGGDRVKDIKEAQRRFHSVRQFLDTLFDGMITVWERHQDGAIHFHALVVCPVDIRTGFDWRQGYRKASAGPWLRVAWHKLKKRLPDFNFGPRHHFEPVKSSGVQMACYLSKYMTKHYGCRQRADKGARIVRYSGVCRENRVIRCANFMWIASIEDGKWKWNMRTDIWRRGVGVLCHKLGVTMQGLKSFVTSNGKPLGRNWAWKLKEIVKELGVSEWKSEGSWWIDGLVGLSAKGGESDG